MRLTAILLATLLPACACAQLDDTVVITAPVPPPAAPAESPASEPQPQPKPEPKPAPARGEVKWMSPRNGAIVFRPGAITLDWRSTYPEGTFFSVAMGETKQAFTIPVAEDLADTNCRWTLPDVAKTTVYLCVKAIDPSGSVLGADTLMLHIIPDEAIVVSKQNQRLWAFHNGRLRQRYVVSTGDVDYDTRDGWFTIYMRSKNHHSTLYDVDMPYALFFSRGQAIHSSTALRQLGRRASHGCVRLPREHARTLFDDSAVGRPVIVTPWGQDMRFLDALSPQAAKPASRIAGR